MEAHSTMVAEWEELMVAPSGGKPTLRSAYFLKPTDSQTPQNHSTPFPLSSNTIFDSKSKLNVSFYGWRMIQKCSQKGWEDWVQKLQPLHGNTWKKAGIYDAILASRCKIMRGRNNILMMKLAENWCPETNTFLFSWGESTVTLEDIMVLGGLPVLGQARHSDEMLCLEKKLNDAHYNMYRNTGQVVREPAWFDHFSGGGGDELEHAAFLVLWLARYIFPTASSYIAKRSLFIIAVNLSRGVSVALAPAVLANIYRDLSLLRNAMSTSSENLEVSLCSPLGLVQVWVWERFPKLSPAPKLIGLGEPRLSRWSEVEPLCLEADEISEFLDSSGQDFLWRPYVRVLTNWDSKKMYSNEKEKYIMACSENDSEAVQVWVRMWRNSELVGMDCVEHYLPHRVGMQFGFDQDVPEPVERLSLGHDSAESALRHFNRPFKDAMIYIPARMFEADITKRYQEAWENRNQERRDIDPNGIKKPSGNEELMDLPPGFEESNDIDPNGIKKASGNDDSMDVPRVFEESNDIAPNETKKGSGNEELMDVPQGYEESNNIDPSGIKKGYGNEELMDLPVNMEILSDAEGRFRTENVKASDVINVQEKDKPREDTEQVSIPVQEKSKSPVELGHENMPISAKRSRCSYSVAEVQEMVTNLENLWALAKAKCCESAAKRMKTGS